MIITKQSITKEAKMNIEPGSGNLRVKQYQGKSQKIALMKCEECGTLFSERKGTVYFGITKPVPEYSPSYPCAMSKQL